jgi:hypothetical protein
MTLKVLPGPGLRLGTQYSQLLRHNVTIYRIGLHVKVERREHHSPPRQSEKSPGAIVVDLW